MDKKVLKGLIDRFEKPNEFLIRAYHWSSEDGADDIEEKDAYELAEKVIEKYGLTTKKYHLEEDFGIDTEKSTLLAAAGIAGIAIGMAAQRSVSNIISGLFLLADQPFEIGDAVDIGGNAGVVLDINLFLTRLRTFDNKYLRIPNDSVANAKIINLSYYDIRRLEIPVEIAYKDDVGTAVEVITGVVTDNKNILAEPEPQVLVSGFGESSIDIVVRVWVQRSEIFGAKTELIMGIKTALEEAGIEIPFPYRTLTFDEGELERLKK